MDAASPSHVERGRARRHWLGLAAGVLGGVAWGAPAAQGRIANCWPAHGSMLLMLGARERIAATVNLPSQRPWMYVIAPSLHEAAHAPLGGFVLEDLLRRGVRLAFVTPSDPSAARLAAAGIEVVKTSFNDFASMRDCVSLTARSLGGDATARAQRYLAFLDAELAEFERWGTRLSNSGEGPSESGTQRSESPAQTRPRVLHVAQLSPSLLVDGSGTIVDEWIRAAGGRNAAQGLTGNLRPVSIEQLLVWNPDVIVIAASSARQARPPGFELLQATRAGRVLVNPDGVFPWDRYGCELPLQIRWAASQLHPGRMHGDDLPERVQTFYRQFFDHALSAQDARRILAGQPPG